ncbi:hypothetical protein FA13DRAFT_1706120 [Coprinellus micaceus]|uniref:Uncharacterized protein n=1 Tax=Coprinellus micaceus TaxID=71717 RepID=A0A4Y7TRY1_COPMI|nr:hypothetical protein FA13DRAFT_1706120 [Coprinellus micaceus]
MDDSLADWECWCDNVSQYGCERPLGVTQSKLEMQMLRHPDIRVPEAPFLAWVWKQMQLTEWYTIEVESGGLKTRCLFWVSITSAERDYTGVGLDKRERVKQCLSEFLLRLISKSTGRWICEVHCGLYSLPRFITSPSSSLLMSVEVNQSNSWGPPPVVVIDHSSQNTGSRRNTRLAIVTPAHSNENVQPIIIETFPTSTTPEPQMVIIAPPPAAAQAPAPSPIHIQPGSYRSRFHTSSLRYFPSEYTPVNLNPAFASPSNYGTVANPPPPDYDSWSFIDDKFSSRHHRNHRSTNEKPSSTEPDPLEEYQSSHHRRRGGEVNRRRRRAESSAGRITFPQYGPPTTVIETNAEEEAMANSPHVPPSSPPPVVVVGPPQGPPVYDQASNPSMYYNALEDSIIAVILGSTAEEDTFGSRIGMGRIRRPMSWRRDYWLRGTLLNPEVFALKLGSFRPKQAKIM